MSLRSKLGLGLATIATVGGFMGEPKVANASEPIAKINIDGIRGEFGDAFIGQGKFPHLIEGRHYGLVIRSNDFYGRLSVLYGKSEEIDYNHEDNNPYSTPSQPEGYFKVQATRQSLTIGRIARAPVNAAYFSFFLGMGYSRINRNITDISGNLKRELVNTSLAIESIENAVDDNAVTCEGGFFYGFGPIGVGVDMSLDLSPGRKPVNTGKFLIGGGKF